MPTILIADDHPLFREALRTTISRLWPDAQIAEAHDVPALHAVVDRHGQADMLLLDLTMPGSDGFEQLVWLRARHPQLPVVIVSAHEDAQSMRRALDHGAFGFIPKSSDVTTLAAALQQVLDGEPWFPGQAQAEGGAGDEEKDAAQRLATLTPQQMRVLQLVAAGRLNKQIAHDLGTSEATVKAHMSAVLRKLGATNRTEAVAMAHRLGWHRP
ncbi:LuxR family transcriptional regulator [Lampropedia cohaerens]|uniref:LuxR family transcriptional regulator n=1 Tax=Lampropedia cohaerens TaxID=1610491 RepID=A0A0U1Q1S7_9BURK|nr:response regulator transcription factor [Lampropedia cohaerens]KKW68718.1 LuxR family transcriptional regulator [Lampropedia cohaerens]